MIKINITTKDIREAKKLCKHFDSIKQYNKFKCNNNWIGYLGEMLFNRFLIEHNIEHKWYGFGVNYPDFKIGSKTIDLKTTYSDSLWFQKPIHDIYIYAQVSKDDSFIFIKSFALRESLSKLATPVVRGDRVDYVIKPENMFPISWLIKEDNQSGKKDICGNNL